MKALPLLLVPGLMCDHAVWAPVLPWVQADRSCTVVDHAQSDSLPEMARQLLASAPPQFLMAGHSMGARVVLEVLRVAPERVRGVALMDTGFLPKPSGAAGDDETAKRLALLQIAREQGISDGTVTIYVRNLLRKFCLNSRLELAAWVHRNDTRLDRRPLPRRPRLRPRTPGGRPAAGGGWKALAIGDRAVHFNGSARSYSINTPQSTSVRLGGG